jgi:hypothetical protein
VDKMSLMWQAESLQMSWCLDCHRNPEQSIRPRDQVFNMTWTPVGDPVHLGNELKKEYHVRNPSSLTNCSTCHR